MSDSSRIVTLTTDFGDGSSYVAAMKGALLSVDPAARIVDLCHSLPPQNLVAAARFLPEVLPYLPRGSIHVIVVDPGVGSDRALLCVSWNGQILLVPDNGCWTSLEPLAEEPITVIRLSRREFWRQKISPTFHGRDILAPVAGHLSRGVSPGDLGDRTTEWRRLALPKARVKGGDVWGEVVHIDHFGDLITNVSASMIGAAPLVRIGDMTISRIVQTYADAEPGSLVALIGSSGQLEVAVVNGSAAERLGLKIGAPVEVLASP
jgi:S-adenosylmethionine hydrolase